MVVGGRRAGHLGQHVLVQVDVFGRRAAARRDIQQSAFLAVHLHPVHAVGADHRHPVAQAVVAVGRLAGGAAHPVALVEHIRLRPAADNVALAVVAVGEVSCSRAARWRCCRAGSLPG